MAMSWLVSAVVRLNASGFTAGMARVTASTSAANLQLRNQLGQLNKNQYAMERYRLRMDALKTASIQLGAQLAGLGSAIGGTFLTKSVEDAAKLQQILLSIKNETGASQRQIEGFYRTAFTIANQNGMTPVEAGEILRSISRLTAGQFSVAMMQQVAPTVAAFASSVHFNRPEISVDEAAKTGIQTAHLFRAYTPAALNTLLDSVYRLSGLMSERPDQALRQMSYYVPMFKLLGIGNETSIATMALLDRAGFRNKVGTNVRAEVLEALGPLQLTAHAQTGKLGLLEQMGIFGSNGKFAWNNRDGSVNFFGELAQIGKWAAAEIKKGFTRGQIANDMFGAFGKQGGTIAALFADPQMTGILAGIEKYLKDANVGLKAASRNRDLGLGYQFSRAMDNFTAVMTELGYPWLTDLTNFFRGVGNSLHDFQAWLHANRDAEKYIGMAVASMTVLLGGLAAVGAVALAFSGAGAIGLGLSGIAAGIAGFGAAISTFMLGTYVSLTSAIPIALNSLRAAIFSFALTMNTSAVAGLPAAFARLGLSMLAIAGPVAVFTAVVAGLVAFIRTAAGDAAEGTVRPGKGKGTYGSYDYWLDYAKKHGANALPSHDLRAEFGPLVGGHRRTRTREVAEGQTPVNVGTIEFHFGNDVSPKSAGQHAAEVLAALKSHPKIALSRGSAFRTAAGLSMGDSVGGMAFGK
jgi:hypothetical protein